MPVFTCLNCHKDSTAVCSCCQNSHYCGTECHDEDWKLRHRYESFLFKAREDFDGGGGEKERDSEKRRRVEVEKIKSESILLREEYQEVNQRLRDAVKNKKRSKKEMSMTHEQRNRAEFNLALGMKEIHLKSDAEVGIEYIENMKQMAKLMREVPLESGEERSVVLGPGEMVEIGHLLMRKKILKVKQALLLLERTYKLSDEIIAYRNLLEERERLFVFNLFIDESDTITYERAMGQIHQNIENFMVESWLRKAYREAALNATKNITEFVDTFQEKQRNGEESERVRVLAWEQREKELDNLESRMTVMKNCVLQYAFATTRNLQRKNISSEEACQNAIKHYQTLSDRIDTISEDRGEQMEEDLERMLRRYYGDKWPEIKSFLFQSEEEDSSSAMGLGVGGFLNNFQVKKGKRVLSVMLKVFLVVGFILYLIGLVSYMFCGASDLDRLKSTALVVHGELGTVDQSLMDVNASLKTFNDMVNTVISHYEQMKKHHFMTQCFTGINAETDQAALDSVKMTAENLLSVVLAEIEKYSTKKNTESGIGILRIVEKALRKYLAADMTDWVVKSNCLEDIGNAYQVMTDQTLTASMAISHDFMTSLLTELSTLALSIGTGIKTITAKITTAREKSKGLLANIEAFNDKYRSSVRRPVISRLFTGESTGYGYSMLANLQRIAASNSTFEKVQYVLFQSPFDDWTNSLLATESRILEAIDDTPLRNTVPIIGFAQGLFTANFFHANVLFYNVVSSVPNTLAFKIASYGLYKIGTTAYIKNKAFELVRGISRLRNGIKNETDLHTIKLSKESLVKVEACRKKMSTLRRKGEASFHNFYDIMIAEDLTPTEAVAVWHNVSEFEKSCASDISVAETCLNLQEYYHHGFTKLTGFFSFAFFAYNFQATLPIFIILSECITFILKTIGLEWLPGSILKFYLMRIAFWMFFSFVTSLGMSGTYRLLQRGSKGAINMLRFLSESKGEKEEEANESKEEKKKKKEEEEEEEEPYGEYFWKSVKYGTIELVETEMVFSLIKEASTDSILTAITNFGYKAIRYSFLITSILFMVINAAVLVDPDNFTEKYFGVRNIFFGWGNATENMYLGTSLGEEFRQKIPSFNEIMTVDQASSMNTSLTQFTETPFTISEVMANSAAAFVQEKTKQLVNIITPSTQIT